MLMPGRRGTLGGNGQWMGAEGSSLLANLSVSTRSLNTPAEYKATIDIVFVDEFVSGDGDSFEAFVTTDDGGGTGSGSDAESGYRYGFNGKENDDFDLVDFGERFYNPQLGRFLSVDPLTSSYPMITPYQFASNKPIVAVDLDGLESKIYTKVSYTVTAAIGQVNYEEIDKQLHQQMIQFVKSQLYIPGPVKVANAEWRELSLEQQNEVIESTIRNYLSFSSSNRMVKDDIIRGTTTVDASMVADFNYNLMTSDKNSDQFKKTIENIERTNDMIEQYSEVVDDKKIGRVSAGVGIVADITQRNLEGVVEKISKVAVDHLIDGMEKKLIARGIITKVATNSVKAGFEVVTSVLQPAQMPDDVYKFQERKVERQKRLTIAGMLNLFINGNRMDVMPISTKMKPVEVDFRPMAVDHTSVNIARPIKQ
jgi:RHS repeat-associated protein